MNGPQDVIVSRIKAASVIVKGGHVMDIVFFQATMSPIILPLVFLPVLDDHIGSFATDMPLIAGVGNGVALDTCVTLASATAIFP